MVPGHQGLLLRENWDELKKTHLRQMEMEVPQLGGKFHVSERMATFSNGSVIDCGHMADAEAVSRYLSTEYGAIVPDEASRYPVDSEGTTPLAELSTRARKVYTDVEGRVVKPRFMPVTNPGGPSAAFLKEFFIDHAPDWDRYPSALKAKYDPADWAYVPAALNENPYQDEDYETQLMILSPWRYEQLAKGNWDVFGGQFFGEWRPSHHVKQIEVARDLFWFGSLDWGFNAPGVMLWWAVLPDGHLHVVRELKFQARPVESVAGDIQKVTRELGVKLKYIAADPAIWQQTGHGRGESVAETLQRYGLPVIKADNDRYNGWLRCHEVLRDAPDGAPWMTVSPDCRYLVRSVPSQQSAKSDPDDIDTGGDDHAVDAWRYGVMSRPLPGSSSKQKAVRPGSYGWLKRESARAVQPLGILGGR